MTASTSWLWKRSDFATEPTRITSEAAEHFWPAWPKARVHDVLDREVEVGARGDDDGVLAAGLGEQRQVRAERAEQLGGLVATGEDDAVDRRVRDQLLAELALAELDEREHVARDAGLPERLDHDGAAALGLLGGLDDDGGAGGERGEHASRPGSRPGSSTAG